MIQEAARRCAGCGRTLRTSRGPYGPVCARRRNGTPPVARIPAVGQIDGQTALDLTHHQPTLWSL